MINDYYYVINKIVLHIHDILLHTEQAALGTSISNVRYEVIMTSECKGQDIISYMMVSWLSDLTANTIH